MFSANQSQFLRYFFHLCILINSANDTAILNRVSVEDISFFLFSLMCHIYIYIIMSKELGFPVFLLAVRTITKQQNMENLWNKKKKKNYGINIAHQQTRHTRASLLSLPKRK